jgi:hypothetical protein
VSKLPSIIKQYHVLMEAVRRKLDQYSSSMRLGAEDSPRVCLFVFLNSKEQQHAQFIFSDKKSHHGKSVSIAGSNI